MTSSCPPRRPETCGATNLPWPRKTGVGQSPAASPRQPVPVPTVSICWRSTASAGRCPLSSAGKAFLEVRQALCRSGNRRRSVPAAGYSAVQARAHLAPWTRSGWPSSRRVARQVLVVEEKRPVMEDQIARHLYALRANMRPGLAGKQDLRGAPLLPAAGELTVAQVRYAIKTVLDQIGVTNERIEAQFAALRSLRIPRTRQRWALTIRPGLFLLRLPAQYEYPDSRRLASRWAASACHGLGSLVVMDRNNAGSSCQWATRGRIDLPGPPRRYAACVREHGRRHVLAFRHPLRSARPSPPRPTSPTRCYYETMPWP